MSKYLRGCYFRFNPWVKQYRRAMGAEVFDAKYKALFDFLRTIRPGEHFKISSLCVQNPSNHIIIRKMIDLYYHMDFFVNLEYDEDNDRVTILPPLFGAKFSAEQVDVYSKIVKDPKAWGVDPDDL